MQMIHGYNVDESSWKTLGGNGQCTTAIKDGKTYFIKRLSTPKYPISEKFTGEFRKKRIQECEDWMRTRKEILRALPGSGSGNITRPLEYFRDGSCYYEVSNYIRVASIPYTEIYRESKMTKARLMMTEAEGFDKIHQAGIVDGDIDPGNLLISRSAGNHLVARIIDLTDAFFANNPPEAIMSKEAWWSPEMALYSTRDREDTASLSEYRQLIGTPTDVFSLGLVFHQYLAPDGAFPTHDCDYPWQALLTEKKLQLHPGIEPEFRTLIESMLQLEPSDRPTMGEVRNYLKAIVDGVPMSKLATSRVISAPATPIKVGSGSNNAGARATSARLDSLDPRRVIVNFNDGTHRTMPLSVAKTKGYIA